MSIRPTLEVLRLDEEHAPVIDGRLDDACWARCAIAELKLPGAPWGAPQQPTAARLATDGKWLFVGFEVTDKTPFPETSELDASGITTRDCVEFYLLAGSDHDGQLFRFAADRFGNHMMNTLILTTTGGQQRSEFVMHWRVAGAVTDNGWSVEMAIPLFYFADTAKSDEPWHVNFCRLDTNPREISSWAPVNMKFAEPDRFGIAAGLGKPMGSAPFAPRLTYVMAGPTTDQTGEYVSLVQVGVANDAPDTAGTVRITMRDEAVSEKPLTITTNVNISAATSQNVLTLSLHRPLEFIPAPSVTLTLEDRLGRWAQTLEHGQGVMEEDCSIWLDRSYYTDEAQAFLYIENFKDQSKIETVRVTLSAAQNQAGYAVEAILQAPNVWRATVPIAELAPGNYHLEVTLEAATQPETTSRMILLNKMPPAPAGNEVKIDHYNQCVLLNGKPFFPMGVCWWQARSADEDFEHLARLGFNNIIRWTPYTGDTNQENTLTALVSNDPALAAAAKHNMMVIDNPKNTRGRDAQNRRLWRWEYPLFVDNYYDWKTNDLPVALSASSPHQSVLGYLSMDEPSDVTLQPGNVPLVRILNDMMVTMKKLAPYHPVFLNFGGMLPDRLDWLNEQSFFASFNYWRVRPDTVTTAQRLATVLAHNLAVADKHHKPLWLMPTIEQNWSAQPVPMAAAENRAQLYLLLIHGAKGINYFCWPWYHVATDASLTELIKEMKILAPALLHRRPQQQVQYTSPDAAGSAVFAALLAEPESQNPLLVLFNSAPETISLRCQLPWLAGTHILNSLFTDETPEFRDGSFAAKLEPLGTRVYRFPKATIANIWHQHDLIIAVSPDQKASADALTVMDENLIPDASFQDESAWLVKAEHRERVSFAPAPEIKADVIPLFDNMVKKWKTTSIFPRSETGRMLVINSGNGGGIYVRSLPLQLRPYHRYNLAAMVRYENVSDGQTVSMVLRDAETNGKPDVFMGLKCGDPSRAEWQMAERTLDVKSDRPDTLRLVIYWNAPAAGKLEIKNVILTDLGPTTNTASLKNRIPNSSFEEARLPGWPDYWEPHGLPDVRALLTKHQLGTSDAPWGVDTNRPFHGQVSLRIEPAITQTHSTPYRRAFYGVPAEEGKTWTFSAWLRALEPDTTVNVQLRGIGAKTFRIGTEWERVSLTGVQSNTLTKAYQDFTTVIIKPRGTIWVDALQLEEGTEVTEYEE